MADSKTKKTSQTQFQVSKGEQTLGPWTIAELAQSLAGGQIAVTDFVFDENVSDWVSVFELEALKEFQRQNKPKGRPQPQQVKKTDEVPEPTVQARHIEEEQVILAPSDDQWFIQKGLHRFGPFSYLGVVRSLQEKSIYEFDLVWKEGMADWVRIAEHEAFTLEKIRELMTATQNVSNVFVSRQYPRVKFESEVLVHDNQSVWVGHSFEGSAGGSGVVIQNATLVPGQSVLLHFSSNDGLPAFNAVCEIVSKKFSKDVRDAKSPVAYSLRFVQMESKAAPRVHDYFMTKTPAKDSKRLVS